MSYFCNMALKIWTNQLKEQLKISVGRKSTKFFYFIFIKCKKVILFGMPNIIICSSKCSLHEMNEEEKEK